VRVSILTHYYPPEVGAPQARLATLAERLTGRGVEVTVHTGFPNYPDGRIKPPYRNRPWLDERDGGVRVVRSLVYPAPNVGFARRLANHLAFAASAIGTARRAGPAEVVVVETPPLFTAAAGVAYTRLLDAPMVLHVSDRWPASAVQLGALRDRRAIALAERLERWCYRHAAAIVVPTDGLTSELERLPEGRGKLRRLGPAVDIGRFRPGQARGDASGPLRLLYAGTIGLAHGLGTLVEAARIVGPDSVEVWIAGDGAEGPALRDELARRPADNVRLLGLLPHEQIPGLYEQVDAAVVLLRDRPAFQAALPTKMFEAMAAARPVVLSARGEAAELLERHRAGLVVPPENPRELAEALQRLARDRAMLTELGTNARRCAEAHSWDTTADRWYELLHDLAPRRKRRTP
jgi:glycosyltransferase involved in cell wall biosynthesis